MIWSPFKNPVAGLCIRPNWTGRPCVACPYCEINSGSGFIRFTAWIAGTSGVVLFALHPESARTLGVAFSARQVKKEYLAVVRGYLPDKGRIHHAYCPPNASEPVDAITDFHCKGTVELPYPVGRYETARYSLMRAMPVTGRQHQIRRHCAHLPSPNHRRCALWRPPSQSLFSIPF